MGKLREEIKDAVDSIDDETVTKYAEGIDKLYSLTADVAVAYENWKNEESSFTKRYSSNDDNDYKWYDEFDNSLGRKYYTDKQLFIYYLTHIYQPR